MENLQKRSNWVDDVLHAITINFQVKISGRSGWAAQHEQQKKLQVKEGGTFFERVGTHFCGFRRCRTTSAADYNHGVWSAPTDHQSTFFSKKNNF